MTSVRTPIQSALWGKTWSVTQLLFGVDYVHDEHGRPLGERRAPADAKRGVAMELATCPYEDERRGGQMNVSALKEITAQFGAVTKDVASFHAAMEPRPDGWEPMFQAVMDQLAAPALHLLRQGSETGPVPLRAAAGHKLAAGYFGALRGLYLAAARGEQVALSADGFLDFVHRRGFLLGASEVCAGQPHNLVRLTRTFFAGRPGHTTAAAPGRVNVARALCDQVRLGLAWTLFDDAMERALLLDGDFASLSPRTDYLARRTADRVAELRDGSADVAAHAALPPDRGASAVSALARLLGPGAAPAATAATVDLIDELIGHGDGGFVVADRGARARVAARIAHALVVYRAFVAAQCSLEGELRAALGVALDPPVKLSALMFPDPRVLRWLEIVTGHRLQCTPAPAPTLALRNHHRVVELAAWRAGESPAGGHNRG